MLRLRSFLVSLLLIMAFGLALAPQPCKGDGQGGPCQVEACACVAACTCQATHILQKASQDAASCHHAAPSAASCCSVEPTPAVTACHGPDNGADFAPPDRHWFAVLPPVLDQLMIFGCPQDTVIAIERTLVQLPQPPPEKPPRLLV